MTTKPTTPKDPMEAIRKRVQASKTNLSRGGLTEIEDGLTLARAEKNEPMIAILEGARVALLAKFEGTNPPSAAMPIDGPRAADDPPIAPPRERRTPPPITISRHSRPTKAPMIMLRIPIAVIPPVLCIAMTSLS